MGPVDLDALNALHKAKVIFDQTPVAFEGQQEWLPYIECATGTDTTPTNDLLTDTPMRNPTLALGTFALIFSNPVTIGLAALGIPTYYFTRSKKRPPESILSALKPEDIRQDLHAEGKLLPKSGTTGLRVALAGMSAVMTAINEAGAEHVAQARIRRKRDKEDWDAFVSVVQLPPRRIMGWLFWMLMLAGCGLAVAYAVFEVDLVAFVAESLEAFRSSNEL